MEEGPAATIIAAARPLAARSGGGKESRGGREEGLVEAAAPPVSLRRSDAGAGFEWTYLASVYIITMHKRIEMYKNVFSTFPKLYSMELWNVKHKNRVMDILE